MVVESDASNDGGFPLIFSYVILTLALNHSILAHTHGERMRKEREHRSELSGEMSALVTPCRLLVDLHFL